MCDSWAFTQPILGHCSFLKSHENIKKPLLLWCFQGVSKSLLICDVFRTYQKVSYIVMFSGRIKKSLISWCFQGVSENLLYCDAFRAYQKAFYIVMFSERIKKSLILCVFRAFIKVSYIIVMFSGHIKTPGKIIQSEAATRGVL